MAKRRSSSRGRRKSTKMQPAITDLQFTFEADTALGSSRYVDTARELSKINRRLYSQSRMYGFQGLTFIWRATGTAVTDLATLEVKISTAGNSWVVQNAHTKGKALWNEMQDLVLDDNPSVKGRWHDYKVKLDYLMTTGRLMNVTDVDGTAIKPGEWDYATYVMPEHDVDPVTGLPLDADEYAPTLIGIDTSVARTPPATGFTGNRCLVTAYEQSRATVQPTDPNVPAGLSTSFFNLLTDSGSQEPELADVIEDENNTPPYDDDEYVGSDTNGVNGCIVGYGAISAAEVDGRIGAFVAPCGLMEIHVTGYDGNGVEITDLDTKMPDIDIILHVAPGMYKGVASVPMGQ